MYAPLANGPAALLDELFDRPASLLQRPIFSFGGAVSGPEYFPGE
jgi:hypothetical protein